MDRPSDGSGDGAARAAEVLGFATFTLDLRAGRLLAAGTAVPLRPKTWAVLLHLVQRPGALVSREELLDAVWPDVAVTPDTLTKSIGELREALGDDPRAPRFIETVHRRGFRFLDVPRAPGAGAADGPTAAPPFVGREAELRRLQQCLARADRGERQLVFVSGPPGVGKTALVEAFLRSPALRGSTARVTWGASIEQHGMREAYMPVLEALERLARGPHAAHVLAVLRSAAPTWLVQIPWLAQQEPGLMQRSFQAARPERMLREAIAMSEALATDATLVVVLEDLHWSDPSTVDLLTRAAQRREPARLLLIATYRPAEVTALDHPLGLAVRALRGQRACTALPLGALSAAAVDAYLAARFAGATPPTTLAATLHAHSDGNPLFLRALVDHMVAQGWILDTAPGWSFDAMPARPDFGVPDDARDLVALQVGRLAPADRRLLEAASVVGDDGGVALLATALDRPADDVAASCEALARGERFLRLVGTAPAPRYAFAHELYRQAVYGEIPPDRRQRLHQRVARALERDLGEGAGERAHRLALHFELAGDVERALHYLPLAAARAGRRLAPREASDYLEHGLALLDRLADDAGARRRQELALRLALGRVQYERFGPASPAFQATAERALALCERSDAPELRFDILHALSHLHAMRADRPAFDRLATELRHTAAALRSPAHELVLDSLFCRAAVEHGRYGEGRRHAEAIRAALRSGRAGDLAVVGADPAVGALNHDALATWIVGDGPRARAVLREAAELAGPEPTPLTRASCLIFATFLGAVSRDPAGALRHSEAALLLTEEHAITHFHAMASAVRGWARLQGADDPGDGIEELERLRASYAGTGGRVFSSWILAYLAEGYLIAGDAGAGLGAVDEGLRIAETTDDRVYWPELWRLKGELLLAPGVRSRAEAETCFRRAIEVARAQEARALELRAATSLARLWLARNRDDEARALVAAALTAVVADDSADQREARALLPPRPRRRRR